MFEDQELSRLSRLTAIITLLQSKRLITATELAKKFGVSVRTIYRDIRALEEAGIPIFTEEGRGYSLVEGYRLPPVSFSEEEAYALITAEQIILRNKDSSLKKSYSSAIAKIKAVLNANSQERTELLEDRMFINKNRGNEDRSHNLLALQKALTGNNLVWMRYQNNDGQASEREVEPFAIYNNKEEDWTLVAYCRLRREFRLFRLDRMVEMKVLKEKFESHAMTIQQYAAKFVRPDNP